MLESPALVLNRSWVPVSTITVRRAVLLMARGAAGAVHPDTFELSGWNAWILGGPRRAGRIRGVGFMFPVPEVIVLHTYDGFPDFPVAFTRRSVYRRDAYRCQYCGAEPALNQLTIDHVVPRSRGGATTWENCVTACLRCNARKADRVASAAGLRLRVRPAAPRWPAGMDPEVLAQRPAWRRFVPSRWRRQVAGL